MTDTVSGLGLAAETSQGKLSASHHYKWQSAVSRPGSFSMRGPSSGARRCVCRSRGPFDFLIPARTRGIQALHEIFHAQSVIYALVAQGSVVRGLQVLSNLGKKKKTFNMHTLWSPAGANARITATQLGGRWVNKCLKFIRGVQRDSYYTNIHACFFSPPPSAVLYAGQSRLSNAVDCDCFLFAVDDVCEISLSKQQRCKLEPRRKQDFY